VLVMPVFLLGSGVDENVEPVVHRAVSEAGA
jgi:hypothetical protein